MMADLPPLEDAEIPDTDPDPVASGDPICLFPGCGTPLVYAGRGRKPKYCDEHKSTRAGSSTGPRGAASDVRAAQDALQLMYDGLTAGLLMLSPAAAKKWAASIDSLQARNAQVLASDKALCKSINRFGQKSARTTFVLAHLAAAAPVAMELQKQMPKRNKAKPRPTAPNEPVSFPDTVPDGWTAAPGNGPDPTYGNGKIAFE